MIVSFLRKLFAGVPQNVMQVLYALFGAAIGVLVNALQAFSVGQVWNTHAIFMMLAGAVATVLTARVLGGLPSAKS